MGKANFEKSLNSLIGILLGIQADGHVNETEAEELQNWCLLQQDHAHRYPFKEIIPLIKSSFANRELTQEEIEDISCLCKNYLNKNPYYDVVTSDIQVLHGILHGILSDNKIKYNELKQLKNWLDDHSHLETTYPYDEIYALLHTIMQDKVLKRNKEKILKAFFSDFIDTKVSYNLNIGEIKQLKKDMNISGICALAPNICIPHNMFCFTGESSRMKRSEISELITNRGGIFNNNINKQTNYLIVGSGGNQCWAFSCYGRKVEKALVFRKEGIPVVIVHEIDFWNAIG